MNTLRRKRLRILLISDYIQLVIGTIAKEIAKWNPELDFTIISGAYINRYIDNPERFFNSFEIVHILNPFLYRRYRNCIHSTIISIIHHVFDWETVKDNILADMVVVASKEWEKYLLSKGVPKSKIFHMPYGVDTDVFMPLLPKRRSKLRRKIGLSEESIAVGVFANAVGVQKDRKGIDVMIEAFRIVRERSSKETALVLSGIGWEQYKNKFLEYDIPYYHSSFIPNHADMREIYGILDCYLITSRIEGGPVPLLEAMSCGIPVVTTPVGMAIDIIKGNYNGIIIPKDDPETTASKLIELIENPNLSSFIAQNGRNTVLESFKWQDSMKRIPYLYGKALENSSKNNKNHQCYTSMQNAQKVSIRFRFIREQLLWAEYLSSRERKTSLKIFFILCVRYPWNLEVWRNLLLTLGNKNITAFFVGLKRVLRKCKIIQ